MRSREVIERHERGRLAVQRHEHDRVGPQREQRRAAALRDPELQHPPTVRELGKLAITLDEMHRFEDVETVRRGFGDVPGDELHTVHDQALAGEDVLDDVLTAECLAQKLEVVGSTLVHPVEVC
ncbi:MAG: hypothetical protein P8J50_15445 [Acidimicrobiales bacterium]|jgi:hypothetical protein|nr:hypothetical protein [Acidimicrobiales bacterium]